MTSFGWIREVFSGCTFGHKNPDGQHPLRLENALMGLLLAPVVVFLVTWFRPLAGLPAAAGLLLVFGHLLLESRDHPPVPRPALQACLLVLLAALVWVALSGTGGIGYQNWDHEKHNAMLNDLILHDWPVRYQSGGSLLVYYIPFYLIPALAGKSGGWILGNVLLWVQLFAFVAVILTWVQRKTGASGLMILPAILAVMFFSGHDWLGHALSTGPPPLNRHLEWWSHFNYMSITTQLFWTPNSAIAAWAGAILLIDALERPSYLRAFMACLMAFFWSPYVLFGILPLLCILLPQRNALRRLSSKDWKWTLALLPAAALACLYYNSKSGTIRLDAVWLHYPDKGDFILDYLGYIALEVFWLLPFFWYFSRKGLLDKMTRQTAATSFAVLALIPLAIAPGINDFIMKASMAPLFILGTVSSRIIVKYLQSPKPRPAKKIIIAMVLLSCFAGMTALHEIARAVHHFSLITQPFHKTDQVPLLKPDWIAELYMGRDNRVFRAPPPH